MKPLTFIDLMVQFNIWYDFSTSSMVEYGPQRLLALIDIE